MPKKKIPWPNDLKQRVFKAVMAGDHYRVIEAREGLRRGIVCHEIKLMLWEMRFRYKRVWPEHILNERTYNEFRKNQNYYLDVLDEVFPIEPRANDV